MSFENAEIRVGKKYQAIIPTTIPLAERNLEAESDKALLIWEPSDQLEDNDIETYIKTIWNERGIPEEQALGILYWCLNDFKTATETLHTLHYIAEPPELSKGEQVFFEEGFRCHGKDFHQLRKMIPRKPLRSLILHYYYRWKQDNKKNYRETRSMESSTEKVVSDSPTKINEN